MSRVWGFFYTTKLATHGSSSSLSQLDRVASLKQSLDGLDALLNDDLDGFDQSLRHNLSS